MPFPGIHARLAALAIRDFDSSVFVPECDSSGEYQQIQTHYSLKWCVDKQGKEIPGIPNSCPSGEPLVSPGSWVLAECSEKTSCPAGYFCSQNGYEGRGLCCRGTAPPPPPITCPSLPITANPVDSSTCVVACRRASDCVQSVCCFNGCGTSCQFETGKSLTLTGPPVAVHALPEENKPVVVSVDSSITKIQPVNTKIITSSVDGKLTKVPVSYRPQTPVISAVQPQKAQEHKYDCSILLEFPRKEYRLTKYLKLSTLERQCWCVDSSGVEVIGTRTTDPEAPPCRRPKICSVSCSQSSCTYGVQLDANGCPHDGVCLCKNPCEDLACSSHKTCALVSVKCDRDPCPPVPRCVATPCYSKHLVTDLYGNAFSCRSNGCLRGECMTAVGEDVGVCCHMPETTKMPDHFIRRSSENSPCNVGDRPAIDPRTKRQFSCRESGEICPTGFYCTGFDPDGAGVCCPGREPLLSKAKASTCPHGDPFASSSDGTPMACSAKVNGCPATHFCLMKPGQKIGVCCVSKRHVCNLSVDRGPCSVSVPRYFYSPMNQTCTRFDYGGCAGNLNNFATNEHCESFCEGVLSDFLTTYNDDAATVETYELGFSLTGPQIPNAARRRAQQTLTDFLSEKFSLSKSSIEDVVIMDDNTARFTIKDAHAGAIAKNISEAFGFLHIYKRGKNPRSRAVKCVYGRFWISFHVDFQAVSLI
ncbi:hypothetical protein ANCCEY_00223 [Ancylostoma ceylanicum]|uniref:Kunitz/Bovine pancreatic trypsin inhibitor domain protein n=1 Tax=Ancylostoma ceylanicum TaxID=53326 RepID=A0A0D6M947_9BILA|nr:hypothetical protein ANCCEY_00223 [Ancylostoma ceylanicum]